MDDLFDNLDVLVVEDDDQFAAFLAEQLALWGCRVRTVEDGRAAQAQIEQACPQLVLTDLSMPEADGLELIMAIRRMPMVIPVIAMSGAFELRTEAYLGASRKLGADAVLVKPFRPWDLREVIVKVMAAPAPEATGAAPIQSA